MTPYRVVVVEDEPLARGATRRLLERDGEVEVIGEAGDGKSGQGLIEKERPDIVFLDIEMPELGGIELVAGLEETARPAIVFVTAFGRFAADAFTHQALDYIVKPYSDDRFFKALERAKERVRERRLSELAERMAGEAGELGVPSQASGRPETRPKAYPVAIPVRRRGRSLLVRTCDLLWIESQDYCSRLHTAGSSHLVRASLASFEQQLDPGQFLRVHRSAIVNLDAVTEITRPGRGATQLVLTDGTLCSVSRSRRKAVERRLLGGSSRAGRD